MKNKDNMNDSEYLKQVGIEFPKDFVFTQDDWKDFYFTLSEFKYRVMRRHGLDPLDIVTPSGRILPNKRSERGSQ